MLLKVRELGSLMSCWSTILGFLVLIHDLEVENSHFLV